MSLEKQAEPILELIRYARGLDQQGKRKATRYELIASRKKAAESMGKRIDTKQAEREIDNARRRVRNAAEKAEQTLRHIVNHDALWDWTDPDRAIREMGARHFGDEFAKLPMTDIEEALKQKGNVLFIIAVYPASRGNVLRYIGKDVQGAAELLYEKAKSVLTTTVTNAKAATRPAPRNLHVRRRSSRS